MLYTRTKIDQVDAILFAELRLNNNIISKVKQHLFNQLKMLSIVR